MSNILVSGSVAYDRIMSFPGLFKDHFLPDKLHNINVSFLIESINESFGGTAGNIAYNLRLLDESPLILNTVGSDGEKYVKYLRGIGVDTSTIRVTDMVTTSGAYIMTDQADNQITGFHMGAGALPYGNPEIRGANLAHIGAGCITDMETLPAYFKNNGIRYFFDPSQAIPALSIGALRGGIDGAAATFCNDYELAMLVKKTGWSEDEIAGKTEILVVTLGAKGARMLSKGQEIEIPPIEVDKVVDPTGAGDAHRAGFIKGYLLGLPIEVIGRLASTTAVYVVESMGTQNHRYTLDELKERYRKAFGDALEI